MGATVPTITAQSFSPSPNAQRWQQFCESVPQGFRGLDEANAKLGQRGAEGWESYAFPGNVMCFKRPAP